jgi:hypothetical protein
MPTIASYHNIAREAWALIQTINATHAAIPLTQFLGPAGTGIIGRHFPANWLEQISITVVPVVPAPSLADLTARMGYADAGAFRVACAGTANLWSVLQLFAGGANFTGITYDDRIYVATAHQNELDLVLHELVHTVQWQRLGPTPFLSSYIQGFARSYPNYPQNPAEQRAYGYQREFTHAAVAARAPLRPAIGKAIRAAPDAAGGAVRDVVQSLNAIPALGITLQSATRGMA